MLLGLFIITLTSANNQISEEVLNKENYSINPSGWKTYGRIKLREEIGNERELRFLEWEIALNKERQNLGRGLSVEEINYFKEIYNITKVRMI